VCGWRRAEDTAARLKAAAAAAMASFDPHKTTVLRDCAAEPPGPPPLPPAAAMLAARAAKATAEAAEAAAEAEADSGDDAPNPLRGLLGEYRCARAYRCTTALIALR
jgi:hypothetical protein